MSYLTVKDVAARFQVSPRKIGQLISSGLLPAYRVSSRSLRLRPQDLPAELPEIPRPPRRKTELPLTGVYLLFLEGALTYVGRSTDLPRRITTHRRAGRVFDSVQVIPCEATVADWLEGELVRALNPAQNVKRFAGRARRIEASLPASPEDWEREQA